MATIWTAGMRITPARLNAGPRGLIARGHRTTSSTTTTSSVGVLRLDDIPVYAGRSYRVFTSGLTFTVTTVGDTPRGRLTYTTDGSTPTTASAQLGAGTRIRAATNAGTEAPIMPLSEMYHATADGLLSVLLVVTRAAGGGSVGIFASATEPIELLVEDLGLDPGDTGTDI